MIRVGIIGYGYWGPNLARNFNNTEGASLGAVADERRDRLNLAKNLYQRISVYEKPEELILNKNIDAIVIATPVSTHYELAKMALNAGKHIIIEKPMTANTAEAIQLIELADAKGLILMVDHTFLYTGAVRKIKELVVSGDLGNLLYFDSTRVNLGLFQSDINVLWDLAPHDLSILSFISNSRPISVNAVGISHTKNGIENIGYVTLHYENNLMANINCSWTSPVKIRKILIGGDKKMIVYDDIEPTEKIRIYDSGYSIRSDDDKNNILVDYRIGDIHVPKLFNNEALSLMAEDFIKSIQKNSRPLSNANLGLQVVEILEAAQKSIHLDGSIVCL